MLWPQKKDDDSSYIQIKVCTLPIHYSMSKKREFCPFEGAEIVDEWSTTDIIKTKMTLSTSFWIWLI
jgi:hypothetical protein